ncbi:hypothetical protein TNCV_1511271 [Trichonephila clavipes]|nr:hypothetical protein TNCV_1511271 [Trichonephila clavipes]
MGSNIPKAHEGVKGSKDSKNLIQLNSVARHLMRAKAYCTQRSILLGLRCMSRCPDQVWIYLLISLVLSGFALSILEIPITGNKNGKESFFGRWFKEIRKIFSLLLGQDKVENEMRPRLWTRAQLAYALRHPCVEVRLLQKQQSARLHVSVVVVQTCFGLQLFKRLIGFPYDPHQGKTLEECAGAA